MVYLHDPQGGATISDQNAVTVVIRANDNVAGRLYFTKTSYLVKEGKISASYNELLEMQTKQNTLLLASARLFHVISK